MSETTWYLGFGASETLFSMNQSYRDSLQAGSDKEQADKLLALLNQFTDECLDQYFISPIERVKLNNMGQKIVSGGVAAIKKTIHMTLKQVVKKMSKADRQHMARYINGLLKPLRESSRYPTYVAVEISPQLRSRLNQAVIQGKEQGVDAVARDYSDALCELVEVALHSYMDKPLGMMKMGMVMNKITSVASDAIRSAAQTVIRKVIPSMSDKEMQGFFEFSESILYPHPA